MTTVSVKHFGALRTFAPRRDALMEANGSWRAVVAVVAHNEPVDPQTDYLTP